MTNPGQRYFGGRIDIVKAQIDRGGVIANWYTAIPCPEARYIVKDERHKLIPRPYSVDDYCVLDGKVSMIGAKVDWTDANTYVKERSVTVRSDDNTIVYTIDVDYTVDYEAGEIARTQTSSIPVGSYIRVDYTWRQPCVSHESGNPRNDCPTCDGNGVLYQAPPIELIGLLHIPNYESPLTKVGFFEMGDAIFTTSSLYKIKAKGALENHTEDNLYIRDILIINDGIQDQVWRVITKPETIQLAQEYLAHKIHIRKVREGEKITNLIKGIT